MSEKEFMSIMNGMCTESLDPETFEKWEEVLSVLKDNRRNLKEGVKKDSDFQDRMKFEENELKIKIEKLYDFSQTDKFAELGDNPKHLMLIQLEAMRTYYKVLTCRISILPLPPLD